MEKTSSYCEYVSLLPLDNIHRHYHDTQYGNKLNCDNELFGRLILEINQAGLSWNIILNKADSIRLAYANYNITKIAKYSQKDIATLLSNPGIIRNRLKINAIINNAQKILEIKANYGSFKSWLDINNKLTIDGWIKLFKQNFKFTGGEITTEFLMSTGNLKGAHIPSCPKYKLTL